MLISCFHLTKRRSLLYFIIPFGKENRCRFHLYLLSSLKGMTLIDVSSFFLQNNLVLAVGFAFSFNATLTLPLKSWTLGFGTWIDQQVFEGFGKKISINPHFLESLVKAEILKVLVNISTTWELLAMWKVLIIPS